MASCVSIDHAYGALLGVFVGDAAGATLEFVPSRITVEMARHATTMPGGGILRVGPGQVTDDSELTIALALALTGRDPEKGLPLDAIAGGYTDWYASNPFDIGNTCRAAFGEGYRYCRERGSGVEGLGEFMTTVASSSCSSSEANGALMRIMPMAIWLAKEPASVVAHAAKQDALLSHPNPVCQECNAAYAITVAHLLTHPADREGALKVAQEYASNHMHTKAKQWLLKDSLDVTHLDCTTMAGHVRYAFTLAFHLLRDEEISYEDAIVKTLQKGGDTDTNAAIVGGLLGSLHGVESIPPRMKDPVLLFDCTNKNMVTGHVRPIAYSARTAQELLLGLL